MPLYRLNYEPKLDPTPWGIEQADGERWFTEAVEIHVPARTVNERRHDRPHGYLECSGRLEFSSTLALILPEVDDGREAA